MFRPSLSVRISFNYIVYRALWTFLGYFTERFRSKKKTVNFDFQYVKRLDNEET